MSAIVGQQIDLVEIATQVVEAAAGIASVITAFKSLGLAEKYYDLYVSQRNFYYDTFQTGLEAPLAAEIYADTPYALSYVGRLAAASNAISGPYGGQSTNAAAWWARHGEVYNTPNDPRLVKELPFDLARVRSDWSNYLFRFEEQFYDTVSDIRFRKRVALHNIGIKQGTAVAASLDSALDQYITHIDDFGNQLATYGNGIAKYAGYKRGMADTADNFSAMEYNPRVPLSDIPDYNYTSRGSQKEPRMLA